MEDLIRLANNERHVKKNIRVNLKHAVRLAALAQSGGLGLALDDLAGLVGCDREALDYLRSIYHLCSLGFAEGESVVLNGSVVCGACRSTVYRLPCIACGFDCWISKVVTTTRHKEQPGAEPVEEFNKTVVKIPGTERRGSEL